MNLEFGFLVSYDWMEALRSLGGEDFKTLLLALIDRQRDGVALPHFENPMVGVFASMIEPTIVRRLKGCENAKSKKTTNAEIAAETVPETLPQGIPQGTLEVCLEASKAKQSKAERTLAKRSLAEHTGAEGAHVREGEEGTPSYAPREETPSLDLQAAPQVASRLPPAPALREEREAAERSALERGVPRAYLEARIGRAEHYAQQSGRRTSDLLWEWWQADRASPMWQRTCAEERSARQTGAAECFSSFETDDFFLAALEHSRRKIAEALAEDDAVDDENAEKL